MELQPFPEILDTVVAAVTGLTLEQIRQLQNQGSLMPKKADIGSKRLVSLDPQAWIRWLTQNSQVEFAEMLDAEFDRFVLESKVVAEIMRWDMAVLPESPWYEEIKQEGIQLGEQRGKLSVVPILAELGLSVEEIAQRLNLSPQQVAQTLDPSVT